VDAENIEFKELLAASGWTQAEAARKLFLQPPSISQYVNGSNRPSRQVLELFKLAIVSYNPGALFPSGNNRERSFHLAEWEAKLIEELRWLQEDDRDRVLKAIKALTRGLPKRERAPISRREKAPKHISTSSEKPSSARFVAGLAEEKSDREHHKTK
jgi:transcriptional regulator with XRE-family HTH domain